MITPDLEQYLIRIAYRLSYNADPPFDPDDLLQEMHLCILERARRDPTFLEQRPGYISRAAAWAARDWCRRQHREKFDTSDYHNLERIEADHLDVDLSLSVQQALGELGEKARLVASAMMAGYRGPALVERVGMSKQLVYYYRQQIRSALEAHAII